MSKASRANKVAGQATEGATQDTDQVAEGTEGEGEGEESFGGVFSAEDIAGGGMDKAEEAANLAENVQDLDDEEKELTKQLAVEEARLAAARKRLAEVKAVKYNAAKDAAKAKAEGLVETIQGCLEVEGLTFDGLAMYSISINAEGIKVCRLVEAWAKGQEPGTATKLTNGNGNGNGNGKVGKELSPREREAVDLRKKGLTYKEISAEMGLSTESGAAASYVAAAKEKGVTV